MARPTRRQQEQQVCDSNGFFEAMEMANPQQNNHTGTTAIVQSTHDLTMHMLYNVYRMCLAFAFFSLCMESVVSFQRDHKLNLLFMHVSLDSLCFLHWLLAMQYFSSGHIEQLYGDLNEDEDRDDTLAFDRAMRDNCVMTRDLMAFIVVITSVLQAVITICIDGVIVMRFTHIRPLDATASILHVLVGIVFSRGVVVLNCVTFCSVFLKHIEAMAMYANKMQTLGWFMSSDPNVLAKHTAEICYNVACLKTSSIVSTRKLEQMVASLIVVIPAAAGCFVNNVANTKLSDLTFQIVSSIVFFVIIATVMAYVILRHDDIKKRMCLIVESPDFIEMYISEDSSDMRYLLACHYLTLLSRLLNTSEWMDMSFLGLHVSDGSIAQRAMLIGALAFTALQSIGHGA